MIQRIQSIYLLLVGIISGGLVFVFCFWKNESKTTRILDLLKSNVILEQISGILFFVIALLAIISLLSYKKRKLQKGINYFSILINLILLGILFSILLNISGETSVSEKGIGSFLPFVSIVLLLLANRAIQKDENLVKSLDRLR